MSVFDSQFRTITCNGPECDKTVTYDVKEAQKVLTAEGNEWLKSVRFVQSSDGRNFAYCSDTCEVKGVGSGLHNQPEVKKIIADAPTPAAVAAAAAAAKNAEAANAAIKAGNPVTLS